MSRASEAVGKQDAAGTTYAQEAAKELNRGFCSLKKASSPKEELGRLLRHPQGISLTVADGFFFFFLLLLRG